MTDKLDKAKDVVVAASNGAKETVAATGDTVDKVFAHVDQYFNAVGNVLSSDQVKEFGQKVVDTGLTVVQVDAIVYAVTWLLSVGALATLTYLFYRIFFVKSVPVTGEERSSLEERRKHLRGMGFSSRSTEEDLELKTIDRRLSTLKPCTVVAHEEWRQIIGAVGGTISSSVLFKTAFLGFNAWKFVAIFEPKLYVVKMSVDRILN